MCTYIQERRGFRAKAEYTRQVQNIWAIGCQSRGEGGWKRTTRVIGETDGAGV